MASPLPVGHYLRKTNTLRKLTSDQNPLHLRTIYQLITHNKLFFFIFSGPDSLIVYYNLCVTVIFLGKLL